MLLIARKSQSRGRDDKRKNVDEQHDERQGSYVRKLLESKPRVELVDETAGGAIGGEQSDENQKREKENAFYNGVFANESLIIGERQIDEVIDDL